MRLNADELSPRQYGDLVTVSNDDGESITMTLRAIHPDPDDPDTIELRGMCMGRSRRLIVDPADVVHIYESSDLPPEYIDDPCPVMSCSLPADHAGMHGSGMPTPSELAVLREDEAEALAGMDEGARA